MQLGLTGFPLTHSLSPRIHQAALDRCAMSGSYTLYPVEPQDRQALRALLARLRAGEINGLNVTIPHKQAVLPLLDELTPAAQAIGAVNTVYMKEGKLIGANTDAPGFLSDLKCFFTQFNLQPGQDPQVLVLGAGGAARAVVYALLKEGWQVLLAARRPEQALALAQDLSGVGLPVKAIALSAQALAPNLDELVLIVNATPLGMALLEERCPWPDELAFPSRAAVYDLVYQPRETVLIRRARAAGLPAENGLGMLLEQAALSFELWTGRKVPLDVLKNALEET
jgi:shikimate dehydrogenase